MLRKILLFTGAAVALTGQLDSCTSAFHCTHWQIRGLNWEPTRCTEGKCEFRICFRNRFNQDDCPLTTSDSLDYVCGGTSGCAELGFRDDEVSISHNQWTCAWATGGQEVSFVLKDSDTFQGGEVTAYPFRKYGDYNFNIPVICSANVNPGLCGGPTGGCVLKVVVPPCPAEPPDPTPKPKVCVDSPYDWKDSEDFHCDDYVEKQWCTRDKELGPNWPEDRKGRNFWHYRGTSNRAASAACCGCGGGSQSSNPNPCRLGAWSEWSECSVSCGGGIRTRTREVFDGSPDGCSSSRTQACNQKPCECRSESTWVDSIGNNCDQYVTGNYCNSSRGYGPGWDPSWGSFQNLTNNGMDATQACCGCGKSACVADILLVVDRSSSIGSGDWRLVSQYVKNRVSFTNFTDGSGTRMGVIAFSTNTRILCPMTWDKNALFECVSKMNYPGGHTNMAAALKQAGDHMERMSLPGRQRYIELLTDGESALPGSPNPAQDTQDEAAALKEAGIIITAIGTGAEANVEELKGIASVPKDAHWVRLADFSALTALSRILTQQCLPAIPPRDDSTMKDIVMDDSVTTETPRCRTFIDKCSSECGSGIAKKTIQSFNGAVCPGEDGFVVCNDTQDLTSLACECQSDEKWEDSEGRNCDVYDIDELCTPSGGKGKGWDGTEIDDYENDGKSAHTACCACGKERCVQDTVIVVDQTSQNWDKVKTYLLARVRNTKYSRGPGPHLGVVGVSEGASVLCPFTFEKDYLLSCVEALSDTTTNGNGNLAAGMDLAQQLLTDYSSPGRMRIIEVVTDKMPESAASAYASAQRVKSKKMKVLAIGVGIPESCKQNKKADGCALYDMVSTLASPDVSAALVPNYDVLGGFAKIADTLVSCDPEDDLVTTDGTTTSEECVSQEEALPTWYLEKKFGGCTAEYMLATLNEYGCVELQPECGTIVCQRFVPDDVFGELSQCYEEQQTVELTSGGIERTSGLVDTSGVGGSGGDQNDEVAEGEPVRTRAAVNAL